MKRAAMIGLVLLGLLPLRADDVPEPHRAAQTRLLELAMKLNAGDRAATLAVWRADLAADPNFDGVDDIAGFQMMGLSLGAQLIDAGGPGGMAAAREVLAALWVRDRIAAVQPLRIAELRRVAKNDAGLDALVSSCEAHLAALPSNPGYDAGVRLRLAVALLALGKAGEADALAAQIDGNLDPATTAARETLRAEAEEKRGDLSAALARLEKLDKAGTGGERGAFLLGYDLILSGRNTDGVAKLATIPVGSPYREAALFSSGLAQLALNDFSAARDAWAGQVAAFPQGPYRVEAAFRLAHLPLYEGKPSDAAVALEAWARDNPSAPARLAAMALGARAGCAHMLGKDAEDEALLLKGAETADDFTALPPALDADFADALRRAGRADAARQADEAALRVGDGPEAPHARGNLALLSLAGTSDAAALEGIRADLEKALASGLTPRTTADVLVGLGDAYAALGQPGKAVPCYQRVYVMYGAWPAPVAQAYWRSGQAFEKLGKRDEAVNTYRELAKRDDLAAQPETALARKRLAELGG